MWFRYACVAGALLLSACAAEVVRTPVQLADSVGISPIEKLAANVEFRLDSGYRRTLAAGTEFQEIGRLPQGRVLKPVDATLTVEGAHMHEAYAVVHDERLVGFYLPVEKGFSPLSLPVKFSLQERKTK